MSTTIASSLSLCFTSMLPDVTFTTSAEWVRIELCRTNVTLLDVTLYPYDRKVTLHDVRDIVEMDCRKQGLQYATYTFKVSDSEGSNNEKPTFSVVYCTYATDTLVSTFTASSALTTRRCFFVERTGMLSMTYYHGAETVNTAVAVTCRTNDGTVTTHRITGSHTYGSAGVAVLNYEYDRLVGEYPGETLLSVTLTAGARTVSYYFVYAKPGLHFTFRNAFNVWEDCLLFCTTTEKPDMERSFAEVGGKTTAYDERPMKEYEVQTSPLPMEEAYWMEQLLFSHDVRLYVAGLQEIHMPRVLITDSSIEPHDNDAESVTVKFTWRYADSRPFIHSMLPPTSAGIFTTQFDNTFQ